MILRLIKQGEITIIRRVQNAFFALLLSLFILFPFYWMLVTSVKVKPDVFAIPPIYFPMRFTIKSFLYFINQGAPRYILNTVIVAMGTLLFTLSLAVPSAYGCARFNFPGKRKFLSGAIITQMFPGVLLIVPLYRLMKFTGLLDSYFSLILANTTIVLPFSLRSCQFPLRRLH